LQLEASTTTQKSAAVDGQPDPQRRPKNQQRNNGNGNNGNNNNGNAKIKKKLKNNNNINNNNVDNGDGSFSFFVNQPKDESKTPHEQQQKQSQTSGFPNFPLAGFAPSTTPLPQPPPQIIVKTTTTKPPKVLLTQPPKPPPVAITGSNTQAGPFGYIDKGTFFTDAHVTEFPERIEVIYQGFIWAIDVAYPTEGRIMHGGVHTVLKDKVKRETIILKDDYIVRIEGRASPFNINRMTFFTAKGKQYGPWGDRRSQV
jgi:hypothetical protein